VHQAPAVDQTLPVFWSPQQPSDIPPSDIITPDMRAAVANPQLARRAGTFGNQTVYLVPSSTGVCLASTSLLAHGAD
jgi:hypothetical protein